MLVHPEATSSKTWLRYRASMLLSAYAIYGIITSTPCPQQQSGHDLDIQCVLYVNFQLLLLYSPDESFKTANVVD